jgi:hypothetical protein
MAKRYDAPNISNIRTRQQPTPAIPQSFQPRQLPVKSAAAGTNKPTIPVGQKPSQISVDKLKVLLLI